MDSICPALGFNNSIPPFFKTLVLCFIVTMKPQNAHICQAVAQLLEERQTHPLKQSMAYNELWMFIKSYTIMFDINKARGQRRLPPGL
jgi:hypothetical protein